MNLISLCSNLALFRNTFLVIFENLLSPNIEWVVLRHFKTSFVFRNSFCWKWIRKLDPLVKNSKLHRDTLLIIGPLYKGSLFFICIYTKVFVSLSLLRLPAFCFSSSNLYSGTWDYDIYRIVNKFVGSVDFLETKLCFSCEFPRWQQRRVSNS